MNVEDELKSIWAAIDSIGATIDSIEHHMGELDGRLIALESQNG